MPLNGLFGAFNIPGKNFLGNFARYAGACADKSLVIFFQQRMVDARAVIETVYMPERHQLHEVVVAGFVFCQQYQMVVFIVLSIFEGMVVMAGNIHFTTEDGLYSRVFFGNIVKLLYPVHIAVVGYCKRRHAELFGPLEEFFYVGQSVKDGILSVDVKGYKCHFIWFLFRRLMLRY